ncbi:LuxR C-terminal-related transcriptional regulator [Paenibacillus lautus]|uniref:LuxR C-terminal-related transcriptional regulator n=1 Tax=Paenibacillus lautus TaxID=1401 RepID=UPI001C7D7D04|nr:LuxR C-terminal-related transcriptional regulator [Paenibacillus lautus]
MRLTVGSSEDNERVREELTELHNMIMKRIIHMQIRDCVQVTMEYVAAEPEFLPAKAEGSVHPLSEECDAAAFLSERQLEIAEMLCQHYSTRRIADELYISVNTVKKHMQNIKKALNLEQAGGDFIYLLSEKLKSWS